MTPPQWPEGASLTASTADDSGVLWVSWPAAEDAVAYQVLLDGTVAGEVVSEASGAQLTHNIELTSGQTATVTVLGVDAAENWTPTGLELGVERPPEPVVQTVRLAGNKLKSQKVERLRARYTSGSGGEGVGLRHLLASADVKASRSSVRTGGGGMGFRGVGSGGGGNGVGRVMGMGRVHPRMKLPPATTLNRERYTHTRSNTFIAVADDPRSTFSIDVDTASYSNVRRMLNNGALPPVDAVRIEELINYFSYDYPQPSGGEPFEIVTEVGPAPWNADHQLVHIGLQGRQLADSEIPGRNLVFLLDVSGSMRGPGRLGLLKSAFGLLVKQLDQHDRISIVVYAGASGVRLLPTAGNEHGTILAALNSLRSGGSTNGAAGIERAYQLAEESFIKGGINRVILATDGDFNVGPSSHGEMVRLVESKRDKGIFLTVLGVGMRNLNDGTMEQMADHGNGNYAYIDTLNEARKVLVNELSSTLVTIAKDTKLQVEFNPANVAAYRLIGYENRVLAHKDFADDKKDAGELGAGHSVTALYEVVPVGAASADVLGTPSVAPLKYQGRRKHSASAGSELVTVKLRYKEPDGDSSRLLTDVVRASDRPLGETSQAYRFSAAVASYAMNLRGSKHLRAFSWSDIKALAEGAVGSDPFGYRAEFLDLVDTASRLPAR